MSVPQFSEEIVKRFTERLVSVQDMGSDPLYNLDHRQYKPTGFPTTKFTLEDVLNYLKENP